MSGKKDKHTSLSDAKKRVKRKVRCTRALSAHPTNTEEPVNAGSSSHMEQDPRKEPASETRLSQEDILVNELLRIVKSNDTTNAYYGMIKDVIVDSQAFDLAFQTVMLEAKQNASGTLLEMNNSTQTEVLFRRVAKLRTMDKIVCLSGLAPFRDDIMGANIEATFGVKKKRSAMDDLMEHIYTMGGEHGTPKPN